MLMLTERFLLSCDPAVTIPAGAILRQHMQTLLQRGYTDRKQILYALSFANGDLEVCRLICWDTFVHVSTRNLNAVF